MTQGNAHQELCRMIKIQLELSGYVVQQEKRIYLKCGGYVAVDLFAKDENGQIVIVECGYTEFISHILQCSNMEAGQDAKNKDKTHRHSKT